MLFRQGDNTHARPICSRSALLGGMGGHEDGVVQRVCFDQCCVLSEPVCPATSAPPQVRAKSRVLVLLPRGHIKQHFSFSLNRPFDGLIRSKRTRCLFFSFRLTISQGETRLVACVCLRKGCVGRLMQGVVAERVVRWTFTDEAMEALSVRC